MVLASLAILMVTTLSTATIVVRRDDEETVVRVAGSSTAEKKPFPSPRNSSTAVGPRRLPTGTYGYFVPTQ